jgi:hypothetical protein
LCIGGIELEEDGAEKIMIRCINDLFKRTRRDARRQAEPAPQ